MKKSFWMALAVFGTASTAMAQQAPNPSEIYIRDIYYSGTGCPKDSVNGMVSADGSVFTATFDQFIAMQGPNWDRLARRKSCNLTVDLHAPQGYSFSIFQLNTIGYVDLDNGTSANQKVAMRFAGDAITSGVNFVTDFYGPADEDFFDTRVVGVESLVWSRCGGGIPLNITTTITATASGSAEALIGVDQQDGKLTHQYGIQWRYCGSGGGGGGSGGNIVPNQPPTVEAGPNLTSSATKPFNWTWYALSGAYANDDGLPLGTLTTKWTKVSGPCNVVFENPNVLNTRFKIVKPASLPNCRGTHVIRLTADDANAQASDDLNIYLN